MVVRDDGKVVEFEIVDIHGISFLDLLLDELIYDGEALSRARTSDDDASAHRIHDIDESVVPNLVVVKSCRQVYRIFVFDQPGFLHETFVFVVEGIVHGMVRHEAADPDSCCEQEDISGDSGQGIQRTDQRNRFGKI